MFETNPKECKNYKGYYHHPDIDDLIFTPKGEVKNCSTGDKIKISDRRGSLTSYPYIKHPNRPVTMVLHRLLAETFLKCPGNRIDYVVNHKDGNKSNYELSNLEWVTYTGNIVHAYETGLRSDNRPIIIKDLETGEVEEFYSLNEAARYFKVNASLIRVYLRNRRLMYPYKDKYEMIYKGEEWRGLTKKDIGKVRPGKARMLVTISHDRKNIVIYESAEHLARDLEINGGTIYWWFKQKYVPRKYGFDLFYLDELKKDNVNKKLLERAEVRKDKEAEKKRDRKRKMVKRKPVPVNITNLLTKETTYWKSIEDFANSKNAKKSTVQRSVWKSGRWKQYKIEYLKKGK